MSMYEKAKSKAKSIWEKAPVGETMSKMSKGLRTTLTTFAQYFSKEEATTTGDPNDIFTGNTMKPERQSVTELRTKSTIPITISQEKNVENPNREVVQKSDRFLHVEWVSDIQNTKAMEGGGSGVDTLTGVPISVPKPMENNAEESEVEYSAKYTNYNGEVESVGPWKADPNDNLTSKTIDQIGRGTLNPVLEFPVGNVQVKFVVDEKVLTEYGVSVENIKQALTDPNYQNPENEELGKFVRNLQYQIATLSLTLESLPTKEDNTGSKFVLVIGRENDGNIATNLSIFIGNDPVSIIVKDSRYIDIGTEIDQMVQEILTINAVFVNEAHESSIESANPKWISQVPSAVMTMLTESNAIAEYVRNQIGQSEPNFKNLSPGNQVEIVIREAKNAYKDPTVMLKAFEEVIQKYPNTQEIYDNIPKIANYSTVQYEGMDGEISDHLNKVFKSMGMDGVEIKITKIREVGASPNFTLTMRLPDGQKLGIDFSPGGVSVAENGTVEVTGSLTDVNGNKEEKVITFLINDSKEPDISGTGDLVIEGENNKIIISIKIPKLVPVDTLTGEVVDGIFDPKMKQVIKSVTINDTLTKTITDPYPNYTSPNDTSPNDTSPNDTLANSSNSQENYQNGEPDVLTGGEDNQTTDDSQKISTPSPDEVLANNLANSNGQNNETDNNTDQKVNFSDGVPDVLTGGEGNQTTSIPKNDYYYDELKILLPSKGDHSLVIPNGYPIDNLTVTDTNGAELTSSITPEGPLFETTNGEAKLVIERDGGKNYYRNQDNKNSFPNNIQNDPLTGDTTNQVDIDPITAILRENLKDVSREKLAILKDVSNIIPPVSPTFDPLTDGGSDTANGEYDEFILGSNNESFEGYGQLPTNKQPISDILPSNPEYLTQGKTDPLTGNTLGSSDNRGDIFIPNDPKTF
jgi:hypothetical protein